MPLRALIDGKDFFADELTEEHRKNKFVCPYSKCSSQLIPVIPHQDIIKHFRHKNGCAHGEAESEEHEAGKYRLKRIAESLGFEATTEYEIGDHITDVYVKSHFPLAIEFQCSKLSTEEIIDRNNTYNQHGVLPLWILGSNFWINRMSTKIEETIAAFQPLIYLDGDFYYYDKSLSHKKYEEVGFCPIREHVKGLIFDRVLVLPINYVFIKEVELAKAKWLEVESEYRRCAFEERKRIEIENTRVYAERLRQEIEFPYLFINNAKFNENARMHAALWRCREIERQNHEFINKKRIDREKHKKLREQKDDEFEQLMQQRRERNKKSNLGLSELNASVEVTHVCGDCSKFHSDSCGFPNGNFEHVPADWYAGNMKCLLLKFPVPTLC